MKRTFLVIIAVIALFSLTITGCKKSVKNNTADKTDKTQKTTKKISGNLKSNISYIIGHSIGTNMKKSYVEIDIGALVNGLKAGLKGDKSKFTPEEAGQIQQDFEADLTKKRTEAMDKKKKDNEDYMEKNKKNAGVTALASGLQYKVITEGAGALPTANDSVKINYKGKLIDGTVFDETYKNNQPIVLPVSGIIKGMEEALLLMKVGSKWEVYIPSELGYGPQDMGNIPSNSILIFELELISIEPQTDQKIKK